MIFTIIYKLLKKEGVICLLYINNGIVDYKGSPDNLYNVKNINEITNIRFDPQEKSFTDFKISKKKQNNKKQEEQFFIFI